MMPKVDELLLMTGEPIPLKDYSVKIHQPSIKEIALIGEDEFFQGLSIFTLDSTPLINFLQSLEHTEEEEAALIDSITDYDNLLFILQATAQIGDSNSVDIEGMARTIFKLVMSDHSFIFNKETSDMILMAKREDLHSIVVDREFFSQVKKVVSEIFIFDKLFGKSEKTEMSAAAQKIADKIAKSEAKIKKINGDGGEEGSFFARIISIMGIQKDINYLTDLTVYQLNNQFERMNLFVNSEQSWQAILAGASDTEMIDWYKKI